MAAMASSLPVTGMGKNGSAFKPSIKSSPRYFSSSFVQQRKTKLCGNTGYKSPTVVCVRYDNGRDSGIGEFVGGFFLGSIIFGALGYLLAPQISQREERVRKNLQKFLEDKEEGLENTRRTLKDKITQLNSAIDGVSAQLKAENGAKVQGPNYGAHEVLSSD